MPTHAYGEDLIKTSKIHNLFIWYPNNTTNILLIIENLLNSGQIGDIKLSATSQ
jgi:hypothetical protein